MLKVIFILTITLSSLTAGWVSKDQYINMLDFHVAVKKAVAKDPEKFEKFRRYLYGIFYQESSLGKYSYSDAEEDKFYYVHLDKKVWLSRDDYEKADHFKNSKSKYVLAKYWGKLWKKKIHILEGQLKPIVEASLGDVMFTVPTARYIIKKKGIDKYKKYLTNDKAIVNALLNDKVFALHLTLLYMEMNYQTALKRGYSKPLLRAVGRHNGFWNNWSYIKKVKYGINYVADAIAENRYNIDGEAYLKRAFNSNN